MNKRISKIYVIIGDGKALFADTNLKSMSDDFLSIAPDLSYTILYNKFKESDVFSKISKNGKTYLFQVIHNKDFEG